MWKAVLAGSESRTVTTGVAALEENVVTAGKSSLTVNDDGKCGENGLEEGKDGCDAGR